MHMFACYLWFALASVVLIALNVLFEENICIDSLLADVGF